MLSAIDFLSALSFATAVSAAIYDIDVGNLNTGIAGLTFTPNVTTAAVGDSLVFHFYPGNHNVAQGAFSKPCQALSGGFYSGFVSPVSGEATEVFTVTVNDTNPIWIYCSEIQHCQLGMAGVINLPASGDTLEAYIAAAANTSNSTTPPAVAGGVLSSNAVSSSSSSLSSSSAPTATMSGSSPANAKPTSQTTSGAASLVDGSSIVWSTLAAALAMGAGWTGIV